MPRPAVARSVAPPDRRSAVVFFLVFLLLLGLVHAYPTWRILSALSLSTGAQGTIALAVAGVAALPVVYIVAIRPRAPEPARRAIGWVAYTSMGFAITLFDVVLVRDLLWGTAWTAGRLLPDLHTDPGTLDSWARTSALSCLGVAAALAMWGLYIANRTPRLREISVPIPDLAPGLQGLRIVQFSDLHVGPTIRRPFVERVVAAIERARPDLIAFTGDLADGGAAELASHVEPLRRLSAPLGLWAVTGNHEYYADPVRWMEMIPRLGLKLLLNEHRSVQRDGARLLVGGLPDPAGTEALPDRPEHRADPAAVFRDAPDGLRLLLVHQPRAALAAAAAGAHLALCGHTHGGQLLPWTALVRLQQPIVAGLHRAPEGGGWIYVNRGAGYWGPPMRLGVSSEITCLTLTAG